MNERQWLRRLFASKASSIIAVLIVTRAKRVGAILLRHAVKLFFVFGMSTGK